MYVVLIVASISTMFAFAFDFRTIALLGFLPAPLIAILPAFLILKNQKNYGKIIGIYIDEANECISFKYYLCEETHEKIMFSDIKLLETRFKAVYASRYRYPPATEITMNYIPAPEITINLEDDKKIEIKKIDYHYLKEFFLVIFRLNEYIPSSHSQDKEVEKIFHRCCEYYQKNRKLPFEYERPITLVFVVLVGFIALVSVVIFLGPSINEFIHELWIEIIRPFVFT